MLAKIRKFVRDTSYVLPICGLRVQVSINKSSSIFIQFSIKLSVICSRLKPILQLSNYILRTFISIKITKHSFDIIEDFILSISLKISLYLSYHLSFLSLFLQGLEERKVI